MNLHAGDQLVIEEFLAGEEASFFALVNGEECVPLIAAQVKFVCEYYSPSTCRVLCRVTADPTVVLDAYHHG